MSQSTKNPIPWGKKITRVYSDGSTEEVVLEPVKVGDIFEGPNGSMFRIIADKGVLGGMNQVRMSKKEVENWKAGKRG
jgi:hypothetical protein